MFRSISTLRELCLDHGKNFDLQVMLVDPGAAEHRRPHRCAR